MKTVIDSNDLDLILKDLIKRINRLEVEIGRLTGHWYGSQIDNKCDEDEDYDEILLEAACDYDAENFGDR
jgi:hypothetical protein